MELISKFKGIRFLLCVIDIFSKYIFSKYAWAWAVPITDKKGVIILSKGLK